MNKVFGTPETLKRLGNFDEFLSSITPNVLIVVSSCDIFGDTPEGQAMLANQVLLNNGKADKIEGHSVQEVAEFALRNLMSAIQTIHPSLLTIFNRHMLIQSIERSVKNSPAAMPFLGHDNMPTAGLVILGQKQTNPLGFLAKLSQVAPQQIFTSLENTAEQIEHIIVLHEAFHLRKGRDWLKNKSQDKESMEDFIEEVGADRFALTQAGKLDGYSNAIENYLMARQLSAAHGIEPSHLTGLALTELGEEATAADYRPYYEAAKGFTEKIIAKVGNKYQNTASLNLPHEIVVMLVHSNKEEQFAQGLDAVVALYKEGKLTPLENKMALQYLSAATKWMDPENRSPALQEALTIVKLEMPEGMRHNKVKTAYVAA